MRHQPSGLVKEMIRQFGPDFRTLLDIDGVHSVKYLVNLRKLEIISSESAFKEVFRKDFLFICLNFLCRSNQKF